MRLPLRPLLILTRPGRTPGPREDVPKPLLVSRSDLPVPAQPRTSDLQPARFGSERPDPPNWGQKALQGPYLCRRFFRFLVWFKADLDIFRSLEETSSESEKRAEAQATEWSGGRARQHPGASGS